MDTRMKCDKDARDQEASIPKCESLWERCGLFTCKKVLDGATSSRVWLSGNRVFDTDGVDCVSQYYVEQSVVDRYLRPGWYEVEGGRSRGITLPQLKFPALPHHFRHVDAQAGVTS